MQRDPAEVLLQLFEGGERSASTSPSHEKIDLCYLIAS